VFGQTKFSQVIQAQEDGQLLTIDGMGQFYMEWYLSVDMKTIKCIYELKHGVNNKHSCIYYMQERSKSDVGTNESAAQASRKKAKTKWHNSLFAEFVKAKSVDLEDYNQ
jgi:hypothetical protein